MWAEWVRRVSGDASARQLAVRVHRSPTSVAKWLREGNPPAEVVIAVARAYNADPIAGLLAAGCLSLPELTPHLRSIVRLTPQSYLADELHKRSEAWEAATVAGVRFQPWWWMPVAGADSRETCGMVTQTMAREPS